MNVKTETIIMKVLDAFDAAFVADEEGKIIECTEKTESLYLYPKNILCQKYVFDIISINSLLRCNHLLEDIKEERNLEQEVEIIRRDGTELVVERNYVPIYDDSGIYKGFYVLDKEISKYKRLKENLELQDIALEATVNGIVITNHNGDIIWVNSSFCKLTGYNPEDLIYKKISILKSGKHDKDFYANMWNTIKNGEIWEGELINKRKNGELYDEFQVITPVIDDNRNIRFFISVKQDITEQKKAKQREQIHQEQLIQADKMVALGTLVSGVAHEINNPNNFVMLNIPLLRKAWDNIIPILEENYKKKGDFYVGNRLKYSKVKDSIPVLLDGITDGAKRIKRIVEELKDFARHEPERQYEKIDINKVIKAAVTLIHNHIKKSTNNFSMHLDENLPAYFGNFQQIEQVIINLIQNSCQALNNITKKIEVISSYNKEENEIVIKIIDEGLGIDKSNIKKIKDPFFTTKRDIGGTGLGLSVSSKIIMNHNGSLDFESELGEGTTAIIRLPLKNNEERGK